eukprot:10645712-Alexandrium_andersonii.AAC.1
MPARCRRRRYAAVAVHTESPRRMQTHDAASAPPPAMTSLLSHLAGCATPVGASSWMPSGSHVTGRHCQVQL